MLPLDAGDEIRRTAIAIRMRGVGGADAAWRIAAQRHDMADADVVIAADDIVDLAARRANAGQMRGRQKPGFRQNAGDGRMGALAGRPSRAIGNGHEAGRERCETLDGVPQIALHLLGLRREEFERDGRRLWRAVPVGRGRRNLGHGTTNSAQQDVRLSCSVLK